MERITVAELLQPVEKLFYGCSSSSSSSDEEIYHTRINFYVEIIVKQYSDLDFKSHFRMERRSINVLIELYTTYYEYRKGGRPQISPEKAVLMTVWYLANLETFRQIADRFNVTLSCAHNIIKYVTEVLVKFGSHYIRWPNEEEAELESNAFREKKNLQNIIGAIDGTHLKINRPQVHEEDYCNRKGFHSFTLQGVVNSKLQFIDIHIGEPGSMHDARVLRRSLLYRKSYEDTSVLFFNKYKLLGDSAYPSLPWLVTPVKDNGHLSIEEKNFNYRHSSTRIVIENAFGHLKGRFRRLQKFDNKAISFMVNCVGAACVLHNICQRERDVNNDLFLEEE